MESYGEFHGIYVGTVKDNDDPKGLGRLKVHIPYITDNVATEDLPWAQACLPYGGVDEKSIFFIPDIEALVVVQFIGGCPYTPIWLGCIHRHNENVPPRQVNDPSKYPNVKIIRTSVGYIEFDDADEELTIKHKTGSFIKFTKDGDIILESARYIKENPHTDSDTEPELSTPYSKG